MTRITLTDPVLIDQVQHAEVVEFRDPSGRVLAKFSAAPTTDAPSPERPAYARADVREFREQLDYALTFDPLKFGESHDTSLVRVARRPPLLVEFYVLEDDKRVVVQAVSAV